MTTTAADTNAGSGTNAGPEGATHNADAPERTTPPGHSVILYDGSCNFCEAQSKNFERIGRKGSVERVDFQQPGALDRFPGLTYDACMEAMHLVAPDGRVYRGFEAVAQLVSTLPVVGAVAYAYYLPGIRQLADFAYGVVARYRYNIMGKKVAHGGCDGGTCSLHFGPKK